MKNINQLLQELLTAYQQHKILLFPPLPKPTPTPAPSVTPSQTGGGFKNWLRNSLNHTTPRSPLQNPTPPPPPSHSFNHEQFARNLGNEFAELLAFILQIQLEDIFYIPADIQNELKTKPFVTSKNYSAKEITEALNRYMHHKSSPWLNHVESLQMTPDELQRLPYAINKQNEYINTLHGHITPQADPKKHQETISALEHLDIVLERINETIPCAAINLLLETLRQLNP